MNFPASTPCPRCGSVWCQSVCRFGNVSLHPAMTHAQAEDVTRRIGARVAQDRRGNLRLQPTEPEAA